MMSSALVGNWYHMWYFKLGFRLGNHFLGNDFYGYNLLQVKAWLTDGKDVRLGDWKAADIEILNTFQLLTAKPVVYLVSIKFYVRDT